MAANSLAGAVGVPVHLLLPFLSCTRNSAPWLLRNSDGCWLARRPGELHAGVAVQQHGEPQSTQYVEQNHTQHQQQPVARTEAIKQGTDSQASRLELELLRDLTPGVSHLSNHEHYSTAVLGVRG